MSKYRGFGIYKRRSQIWMQLGTPITKLIKVSSNRNGIKSNRKVRRAPVYDKMKRRRKKEKWKRQEGKRKEMKTKKGEVEG